MTLDGVIEGPDKWSMDFWGDDIAEFKLQELRSSDAMLLGRVTYEGFAEAWPTMTDEAGFADRMNSLPKYVASTTLQDPTWNASLISGDVAAAVTELKKQDGANILVGGSGRLVQTLIKDDLVDELQLLVYPVVVGAGSRMFHEGIDKTTFSLIESRTFSTGVVLLAYGRASAESTPAT
jgi:dihydrofolate reductase